METEAVTPNAGLKQVIIGKLWITSRDGTRPGSIRINRDFPSKVTLQPGTTMFLYPNTKREGMVADADFSVSILLPVSVADSLIYQQQKNIEDRRIAEANEIAQVELVST